jgi:hypothetical protein
MSDLAKLKALDSRERRVLAAAAVLLPLIALALRLFSLRRVAAALRKLETRRVSRPLAPACIARLTAVAARRGAIRASCMVRSLALRTLLARHGHAAEIRFGARKDEGRMLAHAWVECDGQALLEPPAQPYAVLSRGTGGA